MWSSEARRGPLGEDSSAQALICVLAAETPLRTHVVQVEGVAHVNDSVSCGKALCTKLC